MKQVMETTSVEKSTENPKMKEEDVNFWANINQIVDIGNGLKIRVYVNEAGYLSDEVLDENNNPINNEDDDYESNAPFIEDNESVVEDKEDIIEDNEYIEHNEEVKE
jgi:hypothetical protein